MQFRNPVIKNCTHINLGLDQLNLELNCNCNVAKVTNTGCLHDIATP